MSNDDNGMVESEDGVCPRCGLSGLGVRNHWPDDCIRALREAVGAPARPDRPSYDALLSLYFNAERARIAERSGDITGDTLKVWRQCLEWADTPRNVTDESGCVADYLEMEHESK